MTFNHTGADMSANDTGYSGWQWLELDVVEQVVVNGFKKSFNEAAAKAGLSGYEFDIRKASLTIGDEERGAGHQLAGGEPFYRLSVTAPLDSGDEGLMLMLTLASAFATAGGASGSMGNPPDMSMDRDRRGIAIAAYQLTNFLPEAVALVRKPR